MANYENEAIDDQAARWAARSLSGDFSTADQQAMEKWCEADERHRAALNEYIMIADVSAQALHEADAGQKVTQLAPPTPARAAPRSNWFVAAPAIAASIAAAIVFTFVFVVQPPVAVEQYATQKGEVSEIALADGSVVSLNTNTEISVRYSKDLREIELMRGEALFDVMRDPGRPFVVAASDAEARVLGTRFNVRAMPDEMTVSVLSGRVEVAAMARDLAPAAPVVLAAGSEVTVYESGRMTSPVRKFDPLLVASWRDGVARYENEALGEVVADLNRYFAVRIELGDDRLNDIPVTGGFNLKNQEVAVEALSVALNLRAERRGSSEIILLPHE